MEVSFESKGWKKQMCKVYRKYGICIITDVFPKKECDTLIDGVVTKIEKVCPEVSRKNPESWNKFNLPSHVRTGMFQSVFSNFPEVWKVRCDTRVKKIFKTLYSDLRGKKVKKFVSSVDGINIKHNKQKPYHNENNDKDWAHIDQTDTRNPAGGGEAKWSCVQGQVVLSNTSACFRASPRSHKVFKKILKKCKVPKTDRSNWHKFTDSEIPKVKKLVEKVGGKWQVPIRAPAGSFIVWSSSTIHSAQFADGPEKKSKKDVWKGWRAVFYICLRPYEDFLTPKGSPSAALKKRQGIVDGNRTTNHWGTKQFPKMVGGRHVSLVEYHKTIKELHQNPSKVYKTLGIESPWQKKLVRKLNGN